MAGVFSVALEPVRYVKDFLYTCLMLGSVLGATASFGEVPGAATETPYVRMPEPFIGESITDIDTTEPGEIELDATGLGMSTTDRKAAGWSSGIELEYRANRRLGLAVEVSAGGNVGGAQSRQTLYAVRASAGVFLLNDFAHALHLQLQLGAALYAGSNEEVFELDESALPYFVRVQGAWRHERWSLRATIGGALSSLPPYGAATGNLSVLYDVGARLVDSHRAFVAVEFDADSARQFALACIPEVALNLPNAYLAARVGLGVPIALDPRTRGIGLGVLLRLTVEFDGD